jgi:hypothetical protein
MAKRKARARGKKASRKPSRLRRPAARPKARPRKKPAARKAARPARKAVRRRVARPAPKAARAAARKTSPKKAKAPSSRPKPAALQRERRRLTEEAMLPSAPSSLNYSHKASQAESGRESVLQKRRLHTEGGESLTGGDLDADWGDAFSSGDEAVGGDNPTPDQDIVEEIGRALGVEYEDAEELKGADKITERDKHRWEYDPASAEDYRDRNKKE